MGGQMGGPPLEFINIKHPKRGPPLEFINHWWSAFRFHQPKGGLHLNFINPKGGSASRDNFYGSIIGICFIFLCTPCVYKWSRLFIIWFFWYEGPLKQICKRHFIICLLDVLEGSTNPAYPSCFVNINGTWFLRQSILEASEALKKTGRTVLKKQGCSMQFWS